MALSSLFAHESRAQGGHLPDPVPLPLGQRMLVELPSDEGYLFRTYKIEITDAIIRRRQDIKIELRGAQPARVNFDLYVNHGAPASNWLPAGCDYLAVGPTAEETITIPTDAQQAGPVFIDVRSHSGSPSSALLTVKAGEENLTPIDPVAPPEEADAWLVAGVDTPVKFPRANGNHWMTFVIEVPDFARSLELAIVGATVDFDLYVRAGKPMAEWDEADWFSEADDFNERLVITADSEPPLKTGRYYVDVVPVEAVPTRAFLRATLRPSSPPDPDAPVKPDAEYWGMNLDGILTDGESVDVSLPHSNQRPFSVFGIDADASVSTMLVTLRGGSVDLDLFGSYEEPLIDRAVAQAGSTSGGPDETLYFGEWTSPACQPGRFYVMVYNYAGVPDTATLSIAFNEEPPAGVAVPRGAPMEMLDLGVPHSHTIDKEQSVSARFRVEVPEDAESLHIVVSGATSDIDMYARHGEPIRDLDMDPDFVAYSGRLDEVITIDATTEPPLQAGEYYIEVVSWIDLDMAISFTITVTINEPPTFGQLDLPPFGAIPDLTPLERLLHGVVSVEAEDGSGSGTVLTPNGYILTNHHVIADDDLGGDSVQEDDIYVSFTRDPNEPPLQVLVARAVEWDAELDLALIKVYKTISGDELDDETLSLVWLPIGNPHSMRHGDRLRAIGFPLVGGFESRSSVTYVQGIVAGFTYSRDDGKMDWIKTDAEIASGNSGGAAVNDAGELVGVPTRVRLNADDKLSYCRTVSRIPASWLEVIKKNLPE